MPWGLKRYYGTGGLHYITWSCYGRKPLLGTVARRDLVLTVLELMRSFWSKLPARGRSSALIGIPFDFAQGRLSTARAIGFANVSLRSG
jgi:hypothetical protein